MIKNIRYRISSVKSKAAQSAALAAHQVWKAQYSHFGDAVAKYADRDKKKEYFDIKFLDYLREEQKRNQAISSRIWVINFTVMMLLVLAFHGVSPEASVFGIKLSGLEKYSELVMVASSSMTLVSLMLSVKTAMLQDSIDKLARKIIPQKLFNGYFIKYTDPPLFATSFAMISLKQTKNVLFKHKVLDGFQAIAAYLMVAVTPVYIFLYFLFTILVHLDVALNVLEKPNLPLALNYACVAYAVVTDAICLFCGISMFISRRYNDDELIDILVKTKGNATLRQNLVGVHFKGRLAGTRSASKVP